MNEWDSYGYISAIAHGRAMWLMLLMFLAAKKEPDRKQLSCVRCCLGHAFVDRRLLPFMRALFWPHYAFWYQVSLFGLLLPSIRILPFYCWLFGGGRKGRHAQAIYLSGHAGWLTCLVLNIWNGVFLACPELVEKNGRPTFVYDIKPTILVLFFLVGAFLLHLFVILVRICKANPNMKVQYDPIMFGVVVLFAGNVLISLPVLSGFPVDVLSGVINVFLIFYALTRRHLFQLANAGLFRIMLWCWISVFGNRVF